MLVRLCPGQAFTITAGRADDCFLPGYLYNILVSVRTTDTPHSPRGAFNIPKRLNCYNTNTGSCFSGGRVIGFLVPNRTTKIIFEILYVYNAYRNHQSEESGIHIIINQNELMGNLDCIRSVARGGRKVPMSAQRSNSCCFIHGFSF